MNKEGPKIYSLPKHRPVVEQYVPPRSYDPLETEHRRALPRGALILEQQTEGVEIGGYTLGALEREEDQRQWATLLGGAFLITAQTLYDNATNHDAMTRHVNLPELVHDDGAFMTPEEYDAKALEMIEGAENLSRRFAGEYIDRRHLSGAKYFQIARAFGNVGALLASYPLDLRGVNGQFGTRLLTRANTDSVYTSASALAGHLGQEPTVAQLADRGSAFASYIFRENPVNDEVVRQYNVSLKNAEQARSRINR